jgi:hypothetical protein
VIRILRRIIPAILKVVATLVATSARPRPSTTGLTLHGTSEQRVGDGAWIDTAVEPCAPGDREFVEPSLAGSWVKKWLRLTFRLTMT